MGAEIYVVGMAAVYPGAVDLRQFWETILTRRRGFRAIPSQRLPLGQYGSDNRDDRDRTYVRQAAVLEDFSFDWKAQRIPKGAFEATDPVHWLALSTAGQAIEDAGADLDAVGRERIGVILGNSLTGEVSRANLLRLRWPYVRQAIIQGAERTGLDRSELAALLGEVEAGFKAPFPVPNEDTLAGALANVIAGRICNRLDLGGGGYTVDGACASSLLAVSAACEALTAGRLEMVIAGGVDVSLDPLELVGFARTGALAEGPMRVYDRNATGFLPGEGCGMVVLTTGAQVERLGLKPWARLAGWGISSDGAGGITAPKAAGQALAMSRCYHHCDFPAHTLDFIEGHGTGTPVGDRQELAGFLEVTAGPPGGELRPTGITSVKTLIGHTKAAAGAAGLIKAVLAVNQRVLPPMAGPDQPAEVFASPGARLYPLSQGRSLPPEAGLRAGVSGAGFGGINCHVAISSENVPRRRLAGREADLLLASHQSCELFVASAEDAPGLTERLMELLELSQGMAEGELVDLAAGWAIQDRARPLRAALVAGTVEQLQSRLTHLIGLVEGAGDGKLPPTPPGTLLGRAVSPLRVGLLFPGQGAQFVGMGSRLVRRAGWAAARQGRWDDRFAGLGPAGLSGYTDRPLERADSPAVVERWNRQLANTRVAQPAIVLNSLQWLQWLTRLGVTPAGVAGHSLGEIPALVAARLLAENEALELVQTRAEACAADGVPAGTMTALKCDLATARSLLESVAGYGVVANDNAPDQIVVAGEPDALEALADLARQRGVGAIPLKVSRAFHSRHMDGAARALGRIAALQGEVRQARIPFFSTVQGAAITEPFDPFDYLAGQVTAPVRFREAVTALAGHCDLLVEVGPGGVLAGLARRTLGDALAVCSLEPGPGDQDAGFCTAIGRLFVSGAGLDWQTFYEDRYWRPFVPARQRRFIANPCSQGPKTDLPELVEAVREPPPAAPAPQPVAGDGVEELIRQLVARETGFDLEMIEPQARLGQDLNLDSIKVAEVRAELKARGIELPEELDLGATPIREIAQAARVGDRPGEGQEGTPVPMPRQLPVMGFARVWRPVAPPARGTVARVAILAGAERQDQARTLARDLTAAGVAVDDQGQGGDTRLIVLAGAGGGVTDLLARLAPRLAAGVGSVVFVTGPGLAPMAAFAQSLSLERPELPVLAVELIDGQPLPLALAEIEPGAAVWRQGADGRLARLALEPWQPCVPGEIPLQAGQVVAVSGGAKGITAQCALALARVTRVRSLLLGTSPEDDPGPEVAATLAGFAGEGLEAVYVRCDVTDPASVAAALARGRARLGNAPVAGLIHGAGVNVPTLTGRLEAATLAREYRVKVAGLTHLLDAIGPDNLQLCLAFGSVIGVLGMTGNGGYALANEAMGQQLAHLKAAYPRIQVACPAFSVWAEVGMGAKLNVLAALERQQVAAIPPQEGIRWFLDCCGQGQVPLPLVVAAPMHGLATWRRARGTDGPVDRPFLAPRVVHEPGQVLVTRPTVSPQKDGWLADHVLRGTPLFATVQALAAMAGGSCLLAGQGRVTGFRDLRIDHPIIPAQQGDTAVEVDVRRAEDGGWDGRLGLPGSARTDPAFAARCEVGDPPAGGVHREEEHPHWQPVDPEVGPRLYDHLLFQGPRFRRIQVVVRLDLSDPVRRRGRFRVRREAVDPQAPLPDVYFLDALLQSVQILVPRDRCLPVGIDRLAFCQAAWQGGDTLVQAEITQRTAKGYVTRVEAWNVADGAQVATFEGYRVSIVEHFPHRPDAQALIDPLGQDRAALERWLRVQGLPADLTVALGAVDDRNRLGRQAAAAAQLAGQLGARPGDLTWDGNGAPRMEGQSRGVSISHDAARLLTVAGTGRVGCDLQRLGHDWGQLLPAHRRPLWRELTAALQDQDRAGALVWAVQESLFKAKAPQAPVAFAGLEDGRPRLRLPQGGTLGATILELTLAGPVAVAVAQPAVEAPPEPVDRPWISHYSRELTMTFKEALPPLKSPTASIFFAWMGALREEAMADIRLPLAEAFTGGGKGMVTNGTRVRLAGPVSFAAPLRAWVWLERVLESYPSTFELGFQWAETGPDGQPVRIVAQGRQRLTWVDVGPGGHVTVEPFPGFFADFIACRQPPAAREPFVPPLGHLADFAGEKALWRQMPGDKTRPGETRLTLETDETHSNYVGNIYFSHAGALVERTCQKALKALGGEGGYFATGLQLDHLGEAMPGDVLEARVWLVEVGTGHCCLELALHNRSQGGMKVASGRARYRLYDPVARVPRELPRQLQGLGTREAI